MNNPLEQDEDKLPPALRAVVASDRKWFARYRRKRVFRYRIMTGRELAAFYPEGCIGGGNPNELPDAKWLLVSCRTAVDTQAPGQVSGENLTHFSFPLPVVLWGPATLGDPMVAFGFLMDGVAAGDPLPERIIKSILIGRDVCIPEMNILPATRAAPHGAKAGRGSGGGKQSAGPRPPATLLFVDRK